MEPFTILTAVSSAPAVLKFAHDSVELYSKVKGLKSVSPPRPLAQHDGLTRFEKGQVGEMYAALEAARPVASEIAERALRHYIFVASIVVALLVIVSVILLTIPFRAWLIAVSAAILILGPVGLTGIPRALSDGIPSEDKHAALEFRRVIETIKSEVSGSPTGLVISVRSSGVSILERGFLESYCRAEALTRALECDLLSKNLGRGVSQLYETFTERIFYRGMEILVTLAAAGRLQDVKNNREVLQEAFDKDGLSSMVDEDYLPAGFFDTEFKSLAADERKLEEFLLRAWSSESRRSGRGGRASK